MGDIPRTDNLVGNVPDTFHTVETITPRKPHVVACAVPIQGHTLPMLAICRELVARGFSVSFLGGEQFRADLERIGAGARLVVIPPWITPEQETERERAAPGMPRLLWDMRHVFIGWMARRWEVLKAELEYVRAQDPSREVVVMSETMFVGQQPLNSGCPLPEGYSSLPKVVNIHALPYFMTSYDVPPFGAPLPPDASPEGRARHKVMYEQMNKDVWADLIAYHDGVLASLGCTSVVPNQPFLDTWSSSSAISLQMCPPGAEYKRSDHHPLIKYTGALTPAPLSDSFQYPEWWADITTHRRGRKVVAVTQGTIAQDYTNLLLPTIRALAGRDDLLLVVFLGAKGAKLPAEVEQVPANTRVVDYLRYDALLPHADAWVTNAGYGSFIHGIVNGVPMVLAGASEDKPEIAKRGAYAGIAINLETGTPTPEQIRGGVDQLLEDESFKIRVKEIQKENKELQAMDTVERELIKHAKGSAE